MSIRTLLRRVALKSNRSQDPIVMTNIKISNSTSLNEIFSVIKENPLERVNLYFALRNIAKMTQSNRGEAKFLYEKEYSELLQKADSGFDDISSLEICDYAFFIKITQEYGKKNLLRDSDLFEKKIDYMLENNAFTLRQMLNLIHHTQMSGFGSHGLFCRLFETLKNSRNIFEEINEMKFLSRALRIQRVGINEEFYDFFFDIFKVMYEKDQTDLNSTLFYLKNFAEIDKLRCKHKDLKPIFDKCLEKINMFSENDYQLTLKIYYETQGIVEKPVKDLLMERLGSIIEKESPRITIPFLIDILQVLIVDPECDEFIDKIINFCFKKLKNKEIRLPHLSKLLMHLTHQPNEKFNYILDNKLMNAVSKYHLYDILLFKYRYGQFSVFDWEKVNDESIHDYFQGRSLKSLLMFLDKYSAFENKDIIKVNEMISKRVIDFVNYSPLNARCFNGFEKIVFNSYQKKNIYSERIKKVINQVLLNDFNHMNLLHFFSTDMDNTLILQYMNKYKDLIDSSIFGIALIENCSEIDESKFKFLLQHFPCDNYELAYMIQSFRKKTLVEKPKINPFSLKGSKILDIYKDDLKKISEI